MEPCVRIRQQFLQKRRGRKLHVTHDAKPLLLMEQKQLFKAVDERRADQIFFADAADGQPSLEVVRKDKQDQRKGIGKVWHDKIRQECVGLSAGVLYTRDPQTEHFRLSIRESNKVSFIASPFVAGSSPAAVRADQKKQRAVLKRVPV